MLKDLEQIKQAERISLDLECSSLDFRTGKIAGISIGWRSGTDVKGVPQYTGRYYPIAHEVGENISSEDLAELLSVVKTKPVLVFNVSFEFVWVLDKYGIELNIVSDPAISARMLQMLEKGKGSSLKDLAESLLKVKTIRIEDVLGADNFDFSKADAQDPKAFDYGVQDAVLTFVLDDFLMAKLEHSKMVELYQQVELPSAIIMAQASMEGYYIDETMIQSKKAEFKKSIADLENQIYEMLGVLPFNINSSRTLAEYLEDRLGLVSTKRTAKGALSYSQDALEQIKHEHPVIPLILKWKSWFSVSNSLENIEDLLYEDR